MSDAASLNSTRRHEAAFDAIMPHAQVREQYEGIAREKAEAAVAHRKWEDRGQRNKLLRMLNERQRANLDILESNEAPRPASPTRQDVSEADVTPSKVAPVSRISAAVRAEDRRKAEKVRAGAVFAALGDGAWVSETQEVEMAVEEEVVVKAEEAPIKLNGSVRFEIKTARAAPTRPALDAFSQIEDRVEEAPVRAPVARPKPAAPVEVVEPPVIDCAGGERRRNHIDARLELRLLRHRHAIAATSYRENRQRRRRQRLGGRRGPD